MSLWFVLVYLGAQLALGLWIARGIRTEADYFVGGRRLGVVWVGVSMFATWFGAETCLGASGAIYASGLSGARADPFGYALCLLLMGALLAPRLWRGGFITLGDLYRSRYGAQVERLAVLVIVPSSLIWAAAQVRAFAQVVAATMAVDVTLATYGAAFFVIAYTTFGGLLGDVFTDFVQGIVLSLGLLVIVAVGVAALGGPSEALATVAPQRWSLLSEGESPWVQVDRWSVPILGSLVAQELIARVAASRSATTARRASYLACGLYLFVGASPVVLGLLGPALLPTLAEPEHLLPALAEGLLPPVLYALFSCALLSAILSTIDSVLLGAAALLTHNWVLPMTRGASERAALGWARFFVVLSGLVALTIALHAEGIYALVEAASAFGTAGIVVTTLAALYVRRGGQRAASASLIAGLLTTLVGEYWLEWAAPFLVSLAVSALVFAVVAVIEGHSPLPLQVDGTGSATPDVKR